MKNEHAAYLGLGSNLGWPERQLLEAFDEIAATPGIRLLARSSLYRSAPVGYAAQPDFVNAAAAILTTLAPHALLRALLDIERGHGRVRAQLNGPRTLDLDILLYGELQCHDEALTLPHPRLHERAFVLYPLLEIAPACAIPGRGEARRWLAACAGQQVRHITEEVTYRMALGSLGCAAPAW